MNTERIRELTKDLDVARKLAAELRTECEALSLNHQGEISVFINGAKRSIPVAVNGGKPSGWMSRMVRGREMIMLGIKKAYFSMIEDADSKVEEIKASIAREAA